MFQVRVSASLSDFIGAARLVHNEYCRAGYMAPRTHGMRLTLRDFLPSSATIVAAVDDHRVVGTATAKQWCRAGLPAESAYGECLYSVIVGSTHLMESTKFACEQSAVTAPRGIGRMSIVGTALLRALFDWCRYSRISEWMVVVNPRVLEFYRDELGFDLLLGERRCEHVQNAPGVLLRLRVGDLIAGTIQPTPTAQTLFFQPTAYPAALTSPYRLAVEEVAALLLDNPDLITDANSPEIHELLRTYPHLDGAMDRVIMAARPNAPTGATMSYFYALRPALDQAPEDRVVAPHPFALRQLLADLSVIYDLQAKRRGGGSFQCHVADDVPDQIATDSRLLGRIVATLAEEALDAGPEVSSGVMIDTASTDGSELVLKLTTSTSQSTISPRLREAVRALGGAVEHRMESRGPARLMVTCPVLAFGNALHLSIHLDETNLRLQLTPPLRLLIVEDNVAARVMLERVLTKWGHEVIVATNGAEAVAAVRRSAFDLILMDLQMPVMDGFAAARAIRGLEEEQCGDRPHRIFALTSFVMPGDHERALSAGMDGHISKPVSARALQELLAYVARQAKILPPDATRLARVG